MNVVAGRHPVRDSISYADFQSADAVGVRKVEDANHPFRSASTEIGSKWADRKEPQVQLGVFPVVPDPLQGVVEGAGEGGVLLPGDEPDPLPEEPVLQVIAADQGAAGLGLLPADIEREVEPVREQVIDLAALQRALGGGEIGEVAGFALGKKVAR